MRIRIRGPVTITRAGKPLADAAVIAKLHGATSSDECADYLDLDLAALGLTGGAIQLDYDKKTRRFSAVSEYQAPTKLSAAKLKQLIADTAGQWSDGLGEACFDTLVSRHRLALDLVPEGRTALTAEVIADGKPVKIPTTALAAAAQQGDLAKVKELVAQGVDLEVPMLKYTPLLLAVTYGKRAVALYLIEHGANVKARDPQGWDALLLCGMSNTLKDADAVVIAEALVAKGVKVTSARGKDSYYRRTPLKAAQGKKKLAQFLRDQGATR